MHSPLETLAAFAIAFILGTLFAVTMGIYTRLLHKKCNQTHA